MLPLCAAAGDQSLHFLLYQQQEAEMRDRYGLSERQEIAQRVGMAVERALQSTRPETEPVSFRHRKMQVELSPVSIERQQRDWALSELKRCPAQYRSRLLVASRGTVGDRLFRWCRAIITGAG